MAKSKKTEATPVADVPVPETPIEPAPVAVTQPPAKPKRRRVTPADGWVEVTPASEPAPTPGPAEPTSSDPAPVPKPSKRKTTTKTLADVFAGYLKHLDDRGGSAGTVASYRMELEMAGKALGIDTPVSALTDAQVAAYFESDPVTKKRNGKPKSSLSIDKTRRVLRQALVWAGHADLVPTAVAS
jgi:hypothetical protein